MDDTQLIDNFEHPLRSGHHRWRYFSDQVMGGISAGDAGIENLRGRSALRLRGEVSLANNGGFIQAALDLADGKHIDASAWDGIRVTLSGDGRRYAINLRTADTQRPWQSYRCAVQSEADWKTLDLPFEDFVGHRIEQPLNRARLRRIGIIAIGEPGAVDVAISRLSFYRR